MPASKDPSSSKHQERRQGPSDRRTNHQDRRNAERAAEEIAPRRHPERTDRRSR